MITADRGFIQFLGPDFGFWLLGSSDRGSQRSPANLTFSLLCARCYAVEKMTRNSKALMVSVMELKTIECVANCLPRIIKRGKQFSNSDLADFLSGSTDSVINFSGSTDLHTPIHPPLNITYPSADCRNAWPKISITSMRKFAEFTLYILKCKVGPSFVHLVMSTMFI